MAYEAFIPESGRDALAKLLSASPRFLTALHSALAEEGPMLWRDELANKLSSQLKDFPEADRRTIRGVLGLLSGVLTWREDDDAPKDLVSYLVQTAHESGDGRLAQDAKGWTTLLPFLENVLSIEKLQIGSKAGLLFSQTPRHMHSAHVLTDARPIFTKSVSEGPTGFVIIHTLQIEYFEDGEEREWHIALDSDDLQTLKDAMDRAMQKEKSLKTLLSKTDVPVLTYREDDDAIT